MANKFPLLYCAGLVPLKSHYHNKKLVVEAGKVISQDIIDSNKKIAEEFIITLRHNSNNNQIVARNTKNYNQKQKDLALENMTRHYEPDTLIFSQGDKSSELYILLKGEVEVLINNNVMASIDKSGTYFGEMATLRGEVRSAGIRTKTDCDFYVIPGSIFPQVLKANPEMNLKIAESLAERLALTSIDLQKTQEENLQLSTNNQLLKDKLAKYKSNLDKAKIDIRKYKNAAKTLYANTSKEYNNVLQLITTVAQNSEHQYTSEILTDIYNYMLQNSHMPELGKQGRIKKSKLSKNLTNLTSNDFNPR